MVFVGYSFYFCKGITGKNTKRNKMIAGEKQTNHESQKKILLKSNTDSSVSKTNTEISNSFLQRIISLLKKEELI